MSMMQEFKKFAMRGNVMDMAIGIIIGAAFGKIISSVVGDVIHRDQLFQIDAITQRDAVEVFTGLNGMSQLLSADGFLRRGTVDTEDQDRCCNERSPQDQLEGSIKHSVTFLFVIGVILHCRRHLFKYGSIF